MHLMDLSKTRRDQYFQPAPQNFSRSVTKHGFRCPVEKSDPLVRIHGDHGFSRDCQDSRKPPLRSTQRVGDPCDPHQQQACRHTKKDGGHGQLRAHFNHGFPFWPDPQLPCCTGQTKIDILAPFGKVLVIASSQSEYLIATLFNSYREIELGDVTQHSVQRVLGIEIAEHKAAKPAMLENRSEEHTSEL